MDTVGIFYQDYAPMETFLHSLHGVVLTHTDIFTVWGTIKWGIIFISWHKM